MTEKEAIQALKLEGGLEITGKAKRVADFFAGLDMAITALKKIQQYREIGTVEECREAVEKQKPKQAEHSKWIGINGALYDLCPTCGTNLCTDSFLGEQKENYCGNCGQKLDWSEGE